MELLVFVLLSTTLAAVSPAHIDPILSQFQETGDLGEYEFGYKTGKESRTESRHPDGRTHGAYTYLDSNGVVQLVKYTAGVDGFHAETSNLPVQGAGPGPIQNLHSNPVHQVTGVVAETPEVAAARMQHAAAHVAVLKVLPKLPQEHEPIYRSVPVHQQTRFEGGVLVDTPEVIAARNQHAAAHAAALRVLPQQPVHHSPILRHNQGFAKFAEEIPRSALGETPEVAAAREAHLAFYNKVKSELPEENPNRFF